MKLPWSLASILMFCAGWSLGCWAGANYLTHHVDLIAVQTFVSGAALVAYFSWQKLKRGQ
jgi:hypothetical protein